MDRGCGRMGTFIFVDCGCGLMGTFAFEGRGAVRWGLPFTLAADAVLGLSAFVGR